MLAAYEKDVPIFCPAFSDCSAGFGLVAHQHARGDKPKVSLDSAKDFYELTQLKIANPTTGLLMIGGGVPKNFAQDIVVAADILGTEAPMHKYAIQITVADVRDGALSSSTLKEASSWGKVDTTFEQMVYSEATLALPLITGYAYHKQAHAAPEGSQLVPSAGTRERLIISPEEVFPKRSILPDGPFTFSAPCRRQQLNASTNTYIKYAPLIVQ